MSLGRSRKQNNPTHISTYPVRLVSFGFILPVSHCLCVSFDLGCVYVSSGRLALCASIVICSLFPFPYTQTRLPRGRGAMGHVRSRLASATSFLYESDLHSSPRVAALLLCCLPDITSAWMRMLYWIELPRQLYLAPACSCGRS